MKPSQLYISTIASDAAQAARTYGLGLEIAEYCTAANFDRPDIHAAVAASLSGIQRRTFHAPFNELFPCAIDPKARDLARFRYRQAIAAAQRLGASKVVIHGGFQPYVYYDSWFVQQSTVFWRDFIKECPETVELCLENVLEPDPSFLLQIVRAVDDPRLRLCLDVGHAQVYGKSAAPAQWLSAWAGCLSHFHIHNNFGDRDAHNQLSDGVIPMAALLEQAQALCPAATYTLELQQSLPSVLWLTGQKLLEESL